MKTLYYYTIISNGYANNNQHVDGYWDYTLLNKEAVEELRSKLLKAAEPLFAEVGGPLQLVFVNLVPLATPEGSK